MKLNLVIITCLGVLIYGMLDIIRKKYEFTLHYNSLIFPLIFGLMIGFLFWTL